MECPICNSDMASIEVAPCYDCGHSKEEITELKNDEHEYYLYEIFGEKIILCDFCDADFDSYYPEYFGLLKDLPQEYPFDQNRLKIEDAEVKTDYYCKKCQRRLAFLNFLKTVREKNKNT